MSDIEKKQKELLLDLNEEMGWDSGLGECPGVDASVMTDEMSDYVKESLEELLAEYIEDDKNYVVDGASVTCDQMSNKPVQMYYRDGKLGIKGEGGFTEIDYEVSEQGISLPCFEIDINEQEIGCLHAIQSGQNANGLRFATISDRSCLRDKIEQENKKEGKDVASLISMGNCKIMRDSDVLEIDKRKGKAKIYGTCYCLIKPDTQWVNPFCTESVVGDCDVTGSSNKSKPVCVTTSHHKTMKWNTAEGEEEGLTKLSTLLCTRGGIITIKHSGQTTSLIDERYITIETSGQSAFSNDERYLKLLEVVEEKANKWGEDEQYKIEFVKSVFPILLLEEDRSGIPAEILFAQICIESGYGKNAVGNNYFGVKAVGDEESVRVQTKEEIGGKVIVIEDDFKAYDSMEESIEGHTDLLINVYQQYTSTGTIEDWAKVLKEKGYATDSKYDEKIMSVCRTWGLVE